ncbi:MAG: hypothetical protein J5J00_14075 [Deltaproteobacteria bacterium]|nr:hypothetical protein [Deltaproteobacteria bacterium]
MTNFSRQNKADGGLSGGLFGAARMPLVADAETLRQFGRLQSGELMPVHIKLVDDRNKENFNLQLRELLPSGASAPEVTQDGIRAAIDFRTFVRIAALYGVASVRKVDSFE